MQRDLGAGVREVRVGIGRHEQERLRAESAGADTGDVGEQLVAAEAERPDDPGRERVAREMSWCERHRQFFSRPPTMPPSRSPPPSRCALPPEPSADGRVEVGALQADPTGAGEAVEHEVAAAARGSRS